MNRLASVFAFVVFFCAANAPAATVYLKWSGESNNTAELPPGGEADVEVWIDLVTGDTASGLYFWNTATNGLRQIDSAVVQSGWQDGSLSGVLGDINQFVSFAAISTNGILSSAGSYLLGTQTIRLESCNVNEPIAITIDHSSIAFFDENATEPVWDARYNTSYTGYIAYADYGNPGWAPTKGSFPGAQPTANPLFVQCVPPSSPSTVNRGQCGTPLS